MDYFITNGGHRDICRLYPMLEFSFDKKLLPPELLIHNALRRNAIDFLLLQNDSGLELGYALMLKESLYGYALLACFDVFPTMRGKGIGGEFLELLAWRYAYAQGIIAPVAPAAEKAQICEGLYEAKGWKRQECRVRLKGEQAALMYLPQKGPQDISPALRRIVLDLAGPALCPLRAERYIEIDA